jgi:hypothetical protein
MPVHGYIAAFLLCAFTKAGSLELKYDILGINHPKFSSYLFGVGQKYESMGIEGIVEIINRRYNTEGWDGAETSEVGVSGWAMWSSIYCQPFTTTFLVPVKISAYYKYRSMGYDFNSYISNDKFMQEIKNHAIGFGLGYEMTFSEKLLLEPYLKYGMGFYKYEISGLTSDIHRDSEFSNEMDPDFRAGIFFGVQI